MSVYIDKTGHLVADTVPELHAFASRIGLRRDWFQSKGALSHYDCTTAWRRQRAIRMGAKEVSPREMPGLARKMNGDTP